jgi:hypothetical protein
VVTAGKTKPQEKEVTSRNLRKKEYLARGEPETWEHRPIQKLCHTMREKKTKKNLDEREIVD